jgi:hypothetical protein
MIMRSIVLLAAAVLAVVTDARAQIAVSANDNKVQLDNGVVKVVPNAPPDSVSIIGRSSSATWSRRITGCSSGTAGRRVTRASA